MTKYIIEEIKFGILDETMLAEILYSLPLEFEIKKGHILPKKPDTEPSLEETVIIATHGASLISLRPPKGYRLSDCSFVGPPGIFSPSRVMDECTGGGCCSSFQFTPTELGLPYDIGLTLDIYKFGLY